MGSRVRKPQESIAGMPMPRVKQLPISLPSFDHYKLPPHQHVKVWKTIPVPPLEGHDLDESHPEAHLFQDQLRSHKSGLGPFMGGPDKKVKSSPKGPLEGPDRFINEHIFLENIGMDVIDISFSPSLQAYDSEKFDNLIDYIKNDILNKIDLLDKLYKLDNKSTTTTIQEPTTTNATISENEYSFDSDFKNIILMNFSFSILDKFHNMRDMFDLQKDEIIYEDIPQELNFLRFYHTIFYFMVAFFLTIKKIINSNPEIEKFIRNELDLNIIKLADKLVEVIQLLYIETEDTVTTQDPSKIDISQINTLKLFNINDDVNSIKVFYETLISDGLSTDKFSECEFKDNFSKKYFNIFIEKINNIIEILNGNELLTLMKPNSYEEKLDLNNYLVNYFNSNDIENTENPPYLSMNRPSQINSIKLLEWGMGRNDENKSIWDQITDEDYLDPIDINSNNNVYEELIDIINKLKEGETINENFYIEYPESTNREENNQKLINQYKNILNYMYGIDYEDTTTTNYSEESFIDYTPLNNNLIMKTLLFSFLFFILSNKKTTDLLKQNIQNITKDQSKVILVFAFSLIYYILNLFI